MNWIFDLKITLVNGKKILYICKGNTDDGYYADIKNSLKGIDKIDNINKLISYLKKSVLFICEQVIEYEYGDDVDCSCFSALDNESKIINELKKINNIDEIESIVIEKYVEELNKCIIKYAQLEEISYSLKNKIINKVLYYYGDKIIDEIGLGDFDYINFDKYNNSQSVQIKMLTEKKEEILKNKIDLDCDSEDDQDKIMDIIDGKKVCDY